MKPQLNIFIPTRGRIDKQITMASLSLLHLHNWDVTFVVPQCEEEYWVWTSNTDNLDYITVSDKFKFSDIRQFILTNCKAHYHCVMDDDLYFSYRPFKSRTILRNLKGLPMQQKIPLVNQLFKGIHQLLEDGWVHGGIGAQEYQKGFKGDYEYGNREIRFHFYNSTIVREMGYDFRRIESRQDFDFTLYMLEHGIPNVLVYKYVQHQPSNNSEGGCSRYRTLKVLDQSANRLVELHPESVKKVMKETKESRWGVSNEQTKFLRPDVAIRWLKARRIGLKYIARLQRKPFLQLPYREQQILTSALQAEQLMIHQKPFIGE